MIEELITELAACAPHPDYDDDPQETYETVVETVAEVLKSHGFNLEPNAIYTRVRKLEEE